MEHLQRLCHHIKSNQQKNRQWRVSFALCAKRMACSGAAVCLHWVSGAVWAARDINMSVSECWLADFRSRVESLALSLLAHLLSHTMRQRRRAARRARAGMWRKWMRKRAEQPLHFLFNLWIWLSLAHNQSRSFQSQMRGKKLWQLFTRNQHTLS